MVMIGVEDEVGTRPHPVSFTKGAYPCQRVLPANALA
mgnify:CR=1 FL=1